MDNRDDISKNPSEFKQDPTKPKDLHPKVMDKEILKNSGKDFSKVDPNLVSIAPATGKKVGDNWQGDGNKDTDKEYKTLSDVSLLIGDDGNEDFPYEKLKIEEAFFVPTKPNNTTDNLLAKINKSINQAKQKYGQIEVDERGDEVWECVLIMVRKRDDNGTILLEPNNKPITGANQTNRPKYIYTRNFVAKAVTAGQLLADGVEAEGDGVVVIRVA